MAALAVFTTTFPKLTNGTCVAVGLTPVPLSVTASGLFEAFEAMLNVPAGAGPTAEGVRVSEMEQFELAARVLPQVVEETA